MHSQGTNWKLYTQKYRHIIWGFPRPARSIPNKIWDQHTQAVHWSTVQLSWSPWAHSLHWSTALLSWSLSPLSPLKHSTAELKPLSPLSPLKHSTAEFKPLSPLSPLTRSTAELKPLSPRSCGLTRPFTAAMLQMLSFFSALDKHTHSLQEAVAYKLILVWDIDEWLNRSAKEVQFVLHL